MVSNVLIKIHIYVDIIIIFETMKNENLDYILGKGFKHFCLECGDEFYGRLNQLYHPKCKEVHNNRIARSRNRRANLVLKPLMLNDSILEDLYEVSKKRNGICLDDLKSTDFRPERFSEIIVSQKGIQYFACCLYAWTNEVENNRIHIEKKLLLRTRK
ncbi:MAG TPA: hypothetical protein PLI47_02645 [Bacteroidia bacterium]|nr:hypothetical protein [Bacteroidia bacterium]